MMILAQAHLKIAGLGVVATDALRREALATLEAHAALPFEVTDISVVPGEGTLQIVGRVTNLKAEPGSTLSFRVSAIDRDGNELAGQDVTVTAPAVDQSSNFEATLTVPEEVAG